MDMKSHPLLRQVVADDEKADAAVAAVGSPEELREKQQAWRSAWLEMLGGLPERTPLQAQTTGVIRGDGFIVEKILFQSLPGVYVTSFLYLPDDPRFRRPYPALLFLHGHTDTGKLGEKYCHMAVMAAKAGDRKSVV